MNVPPSFDKPKDNADKDKDKEKAGEVNNSSDKLLKDNAVSDNIEKVVQNYHRYLIVINMILVLFNVMFTEYLWFKFAI